MNAPENMAPGGFLIWPRDEFADPLFRIAEPNKQNAWMWLVFSARFAECQIKTSRGWVKLQRGQLAVTDGFLALAWGWGRKRVRTFLEQLQTLDMIRTEKGQALRVITICEYERFQDMRAAAAHKANKKRPGREQNQDGTTTEHSQTAAQFGAAPAGFGFDLGMGPEAIPILTMRDRVVADGLPLLKALLGKESRLGRSFLGRLLKLAEDDGQRVIDALHDCSRVAPVCPRTWLMQAVRPQRGPKSEPGLAWMVGNGAEGGPIIDGKLA